VEAPDEAAAIKKAIEEFEITDSAMRFGTRGRAGRAIV
jgi:hypothetical protein